MTDASLATLTRRELFALAAGAGVATLRRQSVGDNVGAAYDMVYQALEMLSASATPNAVRSAIGFLKRAIDQNPSFGDAHYYLYLCLQRLKEDPTMQKMHLESATRYASEAKRDSRDPFVLAVPRIYESLPTMGQKWALVVGISQFKPETGAEGLAAAAKDATLVSAALSDPEVGRFSADHVMLLTNEQATTAGIKARLNTIATRAKPEDLVVVYMSTHGSPRKDDLRQVSYLYTYDTDVTSRDQIFGTALAMVDVSGIISNRCVAQRTVVVLDTCHSGASLTSAALSTADLDRLREGAGRYIVSSCEPDQQSYEDREHGLFTASLIEVLRARKGCIRMKDLFAQVRTDVSAKVMSRYKKDQRPVMATSDSASEIVLGAAVGGASEGCLA
jgi:Caspase domain